MMTEDRVIYTIDDSPTLPLEFVFHEEAKHFIVHGGRDVLSKIVPTYFPEGPYTFDSGAPCNYSVTYQSIDDLPTEDVSCSCGEMLIHFED